MNFLERPLSFTRASRVCQTPAEYASAIERTARTGTPALRTACFLIVAAILVIAALA